MQPLLPMQQGTAEARGRVWMTPRAVIQRGGSGKHRELYCLAERCCTYWGNQNEKQSGMVHAGEPQRVPDLCGNALVTCAAAVSSPVTKRGVPGADCLIPPEPADAAAWCPWGCTLPSARLLRCITHDDIHHGHDILCILKYVSPIHIHFTFFCAYVFIFSRFLSLKTYSKLKKTT